jgi:cephalosporin hydroxylase
MSALKEAVQRRLYQSPRAQQLITNAFHRLYYYRADRTWTQTSWMGVPTRKLPLDVWIYQEIVAELRPSLIVETGTRFGGSALFLAHLCDLLGHGSVVTIDIDADAQPEHPRVTYLAGSSTSPTIVDRVRELLPDEGHVLVILDSDHRKHHVAAEIAAYADMVTVGSYLIVEDSNAGGNPVHNEEVPDAGPMGAIRDFLAADSRFAPDRAREKFFFTFNPSGYLRRNGPAASSRPSA